MMNSIHKHFKLEIPYTPHKILTLNKLPLNFDNGIAEVGSNSLSNYIKIGFMKPMLKQVQKLSITLVKVYIVQLHVLYTRKFW